MSLSKKKRVYEVARDLGISSEALLEMVRGMGAQVKSHMSAVDDEVVDALYGRLEREKQRIKDADVTKRQRQADRREASKGEQKKTAGGADQAPPPRTTAAAVAEPAAAPEPAKQPAAPAPPEPAAAKPTAKPAPKPASKPAARRPPAPPAPFRPSQSALKPGEQPARRPVTPRPAAGRPRPQARTGGGGPMPPPYSPGAPSGGPRRGGRRKKEKKVDRDEVRRNVKKTLSLIDGPKKTKRRRKTREDGTAVVDEPRIVRATEFITLGEIASLMDEDPSEVIAACMRLGVMATINQRLDKDTIVTLADEFEYEVEFITEWGKEQVEGTEEVEENPEPRAPVVTVMGHVDHGKTTLLDSIRSTNVAAREAGKITQHIGAYVVQHKKRQITFLDTPGHAAFTAMRARGAQVTDIVVLVVAADDRIMPQTIEAIDHAKAAEVPLIVAINKIDLPGANADQVKQELLRHNIMVEDLGGEVVSVPISAKQGTNIEQLLEMILLVADVQELKADPSIRPRGVVLEAKVEQGRGVVGSVLIQRGTLKVGDPFVCGVHSGKVRALHNEWGDDVVEAGPSVPVEVLGWDGVPQAGDTFAVMADEREASEIAHKRQILAREQQLQRQRAVTLADLHTRMAEGSISELNMIIKADVDGSVQALTESLEQLSTDEVKLNVIHSGVGNVNESDVILATASQAVIIGFHVRTEARASAMANEKGIDVHSYRVIYEAVESVKKAMEGLLKAEEREVVIGAAEVRQTFKTPRTVVAGCYVTEGKILRSAQARVFRGGETIYTGRIGSLKRFKDDAREVAAGYECGIALADFDGVKERDIIEVFRIEQIARTL